MASYYSDPNLQAALLAQAAYEADRQQDGGDQGGGFLDTLGKAALVAGAGTLAALGGRRLLNNRAARNAAQQVSVEDLGNIGRNAEETVRRAASRQQTAPAPSQRPPTPSQPPTARPTPGGMVERLGTMEENARVARAERMPGIVQTDLSNISPERARATLGIQKVSVEDLGNPPATTGDQSLLGQFSPYGQLQEGVDDVVSEVKALPPSRPSGTDFLASQLGGRGYIEQTVLNRAAEQAAGDLIDEVSAFSNKGARSEIARQAASIQSQERKNLWNLVSEIQNETLVNQQQATRAFNVDQAINALESGEDQMTGRTMSALQRNEDIDIGTVDRLQDTYEAPLRTQTQPTESLANQQDASVNAVADMMPDGRPLDQAEGIRQLGNQNERAQALLSKQVAMQKRREPLLDVEYKVYDLVGKAAEQGVKLEPARALSLLTNPTIEMDATEQRLFGVNPAIGKMALKGQTFDPGQQQTGASLSLLGEKLKSIPNVGEDPTSLITHAASGTTIRGRSRVPNVPDEFRTRVSSSGRPVESDNVLIDEGGTVTAYPGEDLSEMVFETKEPGYIRRVRNPEVSNKFLAEYAPKGMRAVQTQEGKPYFVPVGDPGGIGVYGEERRFASGPLVKFDDPTREQVAGEYTKTASRIPTELPFEERGRDPFTGVSNEGLMRSMEKSGPTGQRAIENELQRRQRVQQSVVISEQLRRAQIEGRDPKDFLQNFKFKQ
jgi:hypothetical protein